MQDLRPSAESRLAGMIDLAPGIRSLQVHYDGAVLLAKLLEQGALNWNVGDCKSEQAGGSTPVRASSQAHGRSAHRLIPDPQCGQRPGGEIGRHSGLKIRRFPA